MEDAILKYLCYPIVNCRRRRWQKIVFWNKIQGKLEIWICKTSSQGWTLNLNFSNSWEIITSLVCQIPQWITLSRPLAKIRRIMRPHPCRLLSWQNISLAQLDQTEMRRLGWRGTKIRFFIALLLFQGFQLSYRSSQLNCSLITATLVQYNN